MTSDDMTAGTLLTVATWIFTSDLHGRVGHYEALWRIVEDERPDAVLLGGDLLPNGLDQSWADHGDGDFVSSWLAPRVRTVRERAAPTPPRVLLVPGNDDERAYERIFRSFSDDGLWEWVHGRTVKVGEFDVMGYGCVPPTPFGLKDWERYDVSRSVDPGCVSPEEGLRTVAVDPQEIRWTTIADELDAIAGNGPLQRTVCLFHVPPYDTDLDRADLDGRTVDHVPVDVHVGSIAVRRFIEDRSPLAALCGHVHESTRLTGSWRQQVGASWCLQAAWDGPELSVIRFDPARAGAATRELITP